VTMFSELFPEIQERVLRYCSMEDLKNLSLANKEHRELLQPHMFHTVRVSESDFEDLKDDPQETNKQLEKLYSSKILLVVPDVKYTSLWTYTSISKLHHLRELNLDYCENVDSTCIHILCKGLLRLKVLKVSFSTISSPECKSISTLPVLEELYTCQCKGVDNEALSHLSTISTLKVLALRSCVNISDEGFRSIGNLNRLEYLSVNDCSLTDTAFFYISSLKNLKKLDALDCEGLTDTGMSHLSGMRSLQELNVLWCSCLTNASVRHMSRMRSLSMLDVRWSGISDVSLLAHVPQVFHQNMISV